MSTYNQRYREFGKLFSDITIKNKIHKQMIAYLTNVPQTDMIMLYRFLDILKNLYIEPNEHQFIENIRAELQKRQTIQTTTTNIVGYINNYNGNMNILSDLLTFFI